MGSSRTHCQSHRTPSALKGFSLIEILIALGIVSIIMSVALSGNGSFNKSILLSQAAYSVATTIREAQSYGIANRSLDINAGYGFHINMGSGPTKEYLVFADTYPYAYYAGSEECHGNEDYRLPDAKPGNCLYDPADDMLIHSYSLQKDIAITAFCGTRADGQFLCTPISDQSQTCTPWSDGGPEELSIVFSRPNTGAMLKGLYSNGYREDFVEVTLAIQTPDLSTRYVTVRDTGQVSVHTTCP